MWIINPIKTKDIIKLFKFLLIPFDRIFIIHLFFTKHQITISQGRYKFCMHTFQNSVLCTIRCTSICIIFEKTWKIMLRDSSKLLPKMNIIFLKTQGDGIILSMANLYHRQKMDDLLVNIGNFCHQNCGRQNLGRNRFQNPDNGGKGVVVYNE